MASETKEINRENVESPIITSNNNNINAPKYGTVIPNRVFVGGISSTTTEGDLVQLFSTYGQVVGSKIIFDRAGVSKGYGFVTFATEDEAKRLQKDAENIMLSGRRLNIAPAIKKQGFARNSFEAAHSGTTSPISLPSNHIMRQNGVTFTFHNGMAFFPQQTIQSPAASPVTPIQNHVEQSPVYTTGNPYGNMAQPSTPPAFPYSYLPPGQYFYHTAHYPYPLPIDGCYPVGEGHNGMIMPAPTAGESGGVMVPTQYYITQPAPQTELTYYNPQSHVAQITMPPQDAASPMLYTTPRTYDTNSSPIIYSEQNGVENSTPVTNLTNLTEGIEKNRRATSDTPVVSMLKTYNQRGRDLNVGSRGRARGPTHFKGRKLQPANDNNDFKGRKLQPANDYNNNPDVHNKNNYTGPTTPIMRSRRIHSFQHYNNLTNSQTIRPSYPHPHHDHSRNPQPYPVQVPQFPYYSPGPRQYFTPAYTGSPTRRGGALGPRNKYNGRGRGKWCNRESIIDNGIEEGCLMPNTLTPPITPRSPQDNDATQTEVLNSIETLTI